MMTGLPRLLQPTTDDFDLVLSWLPTGGAEQLRARLMRAKGQLVRDDLVAGKTADRDAEAESVLAAWLLELEEEANTGAPGRRKWIQALLRYIEQPHSR